MNFKHLVLLLFLIIGILSAIIMKQLVVVQTIKNKPFIVCTTTIIKDTVQNIVQDTIEVISLMGPGVDPHLYKPIESDVIKISTAEIIFYNGLHLEAKMADLFEELKKNKTTVAVTQTIPKSMLIPVNEYDQIFDPHVWFDIHLWIFAVNNICQALIKKFPNHKKLYTNNSKKYIAHLEQLLKKTKELMKIIPKEKRIVITGHDAFSYFGRLYECQVIGLQGISTESSPGAYDIEQIIKLIYNHDIQAIFIESSIPIKNILAIKEGVATRDKKVNLGGELFSDALGAQNSPANSYIKMIEHNVKTIVAALASE
jgi:manganese/zinc/iron transport system substrate-binding protein